MGISEMITIKMKVDSLTIQSKRKQLKVMLITLLHSMWRYDSKQNDTQHNNTLHNDTQHQGTHNNDTQHNDFHHKQ